MQRVLIIGSNGAGKSTFSFRLEKLSGLPLVHIDQIYWRGEWDVTPREEFEALVRAEAQKEAWIIEGNNVKSLRDRLARADTVFWFEFPPAVCVWQIVKREWRYRGKVRPDMPDGCVSRLSLSFLRYAWEFNAKNRERMEELLKEFPEVQVIRFTRRSQVERWLNEYAKEKGNDEKV